MYGSDLGADGVTGDEQALGDHTQGQVRLKVGEQAELGRVKGEAPVGPVGPAVTARRNSSTWSTSTP